LITALVLVLTLVMAACGDDDTGGEATGGDVSCAVEDLDLVTAGTLTVATGEPAFPPWVSGPDGANFDDPESGTGFEAALVYALAEEMGFDAGNVTWVRTGFDEAIAPGPKDYDFNLQQYSITETREEVVDFSDPYYTTKQALVAFPDSSVVGATTLADLKGATLGAQIGTTSLDFIEDVIQPDTQASVYDSNVDAKSALEAGQIDGIVLDLPTAYYVTAVEIEGSVIVAEFETEAAEPDEFGLLFADGSSLRTCVNEALGTLRDNGTLDALEDEWLVSAGGIVTISE
jgi:polar amino acid transport system substrate-binding protein